MGILKTIRAPKFAGRKIEDPPVLREFCIIRKLFGKFRNTKAARRRLHTGLDKVAHRRYEISLRIRDKRLTFRAGIILRVFDSWSPAERLELAAHGTRERVLRLKSITRNNNFARRFNRRGIIISDQWPACQFGFDYSGRSCLPIDAEQMRGYAHKSRYL